MLESKETTFDSRLNDANTRITDINVTNTNLLEANDNFKNEAQLLRKQIDDLQDQLSSKDTAIKSKNDQISSLNMTITTKDQDLAKKEECNNELFTQLQDTLEACETLENDAEFHREQQFENFNAGHSIPTTLTHLHVGMSTGDMTPTGTGLQAGLCTPKISPIRITTQEVKLPESPKLEDIQNIVGHCVEAPEAPVMPPAPIINELDLSAEGFPTGHEWNQDGHVGPDKTMYEPLIEEVNDPEINEPEVNEAPGTAPLINLGLPVFRQEPAPTEAIKTPVLSPVRNDTPEPAAPKQTARKAKKATTPVAKPVGATSRSNGGWVSAGGTRYTKAGKPDRRGNPLKSATSPAAKASSSKAATSKTSSTKAKRPTKIFSDEIEELFSKSEPLSRIKRALQFASTEELANCTTSAILTRASMLGAINLLKTPNGIVDDIPSIRKLLDYVILLAKAEVRDAKLPSMVDQRINLQELNAVSDGEINEDAKQPPKVSWYKYAKHLNKGTAKKGPKVGSTAPKWANAQFVQTEKIMHLITEEIGMYSTKIQGYLKIDVPTTFDNLDTAQLGKLKRCVNAIRDDVAEHTPEDLERKGGSFLRWKSWYELNFPHNPKGFLDPDAEEVYIYLKMLREWRKNASKNAYDSLVWFAKTAGLKFPNKSQFPCGKILTAKVQNWSKGEDATDLEGVTIRVNRLAFTPEDIVNFERLACAGSTNAAAVLVMIWSSSRPIHLQRSTIEEIDLKWKSAKIFCFSGKRRGAWKPYRFRASLISLSSPERPWWNVLHKIKNEKGRQHFFETASGSDMSVDQISAWIKKTVSGWCTDIRILNTKSSYSGRLFIPGLCSICGISTTDSLAVGLWRDGRFEYISDSSMPMLYDDNRLMKGELLRRKIATALLDWNRVYQDDFKSFELFGFMLFIVRNQRNKCEVLQAIPWGVEVEKRLWGLE